MYLNIGRYQWINCPRWIDSWVLFRDMAPVQRRFIYFVTCRLSPRVSADDNVALQYIDLAPLIRVRSYFYLWPHCLSYSLVFHQRHLSSLLEAKMEARLIVSEIVTHSISLNTLLLHVSNYKPDISETDDAFLIFFLFEWWLIYVHT